MSKQGTQKAKGIAVDTHVRRLARKFDLTDEQNPGKIETDLMQIVPSSEWLTFTLRMIDYGRDYSPARKHDCANTPLTKIYPNAAAR